MLSLWAWFFSIQEEVGGRGKRKRIHVFSKLHGVKVLKKQRSHEKKELMYVWFIIFLFLCLSLLAWFFIIRGKGGNMLSLLAWFYQLQKKWGWGEGGGGGRKRIPVFSKLHGVKVLKKQRSHEKENWCIHDLWFLNFYGLIVSMIFFVYRGKGEICSHCEHGIFEFQNCQHIFWIGDKITSHKNIISPFLIIIFMLLFVTMIFKFHEQKYSCSQC